MLLSRQDLEKRENEMLAPYAMKNSMSAGRVFMEPKDPFRLPFQRDRARILHCRAFRRLQAKTQVFTSGSGDHYRTRMTHSLEVAQIARDTARTLGLNEDLAETIGLAHDLGQPPFGHGGEDALDEMMKEYGGKFEHNEQSRRIVEKLEKVHAGFDGLNLTKEVLDGLVKHTPEKYELHADFETSSHLEAQVVDVADAIAYTSHDLDDGIRSKLLDIKKICDFQIWRDAEKQAVEAYGDEIIKYIGANRRRYYSRVISKIIMIMVQDIQQNTGTYIEKNGIDTVEKIRRHKGKIVQFSPGMYKKYMELRDYLMRNFYLHPSIAAEIDKGKTIIKDLFKFYLENTKKIPEKYLAFKGQGEDIYIVVKDYISGMTDSYAREKWLKIASVLKAD